MVVEDFRVVEEDFRVVEDLMEVVVTEVEAERRVVVIMVIPP